jgi:hypothetical protein
MHQTTAQLHHMLWDRHSMHYAPVADAGVLCVATPKTVVWLVGVQAAYVRPQAFRQSSVDPRANYSAVGMPDAQHTPLLTSVFLSNAWWTVCQYAYLSLGCQHAYSTSHQLTSSSAAQPSHQAARCMCGCGSQVFWHCHEAVVHCCPQHSRQLCFVAA